MNERKAKQNRRKMDSNECQFCGVTNEQHVDEYGESLHVHHIVPQRADGSDTPDNFITVCESCHNVLEHTQARGFEQLKSELLSAGIDQQRDELLNRVEQLERAIRNPEFYVQVLNRTSVSGEAVTKVVGNRINVTSNADTAYSDYDEWGDSIQRVRLSGDGSEIKEAAEKAFDGHFDSVVWALRELR